MKKFAIGSQFPTFLSAATLTIISVMLLVNVFAVMAASWESKVSRNAEDQDDKWLAKQADTGNDNDFNDNSEYMEKLASILYPRRRMALGERWPVMTAAEKRQSSYRQCYFNPVSCFRKRK